jgi:phosphoadenosine phosphosulfate reductase
MLKPTELHRTQADTSAPQHKVAVFTERLAEASPHQVIEVAASAMPGRVAVVSSFGTESAALLKIVADVDPSLPILFLDTLWLFKQTLAYRDMLVAHLGLTNVRTITPSPSALALRDPKNDLCFNDRDTCCGIRKVSPLAKELEAFEGWISGRKRYHGGQRARLSVVETDGPRLKFNPLARLTSAELNAIFESAKLPRHPLEGVGFASVGCVPCTSRPSIGAPLRDGRWSGLAKTECGIHSGPLTATAATAATAATSGAATLPIASKPTSI